MWVNILATGMNILLDYILVFGLWGFPEMGIRGAGIATVLSGVFSFLAIHPVGLQASVTTQSITS